MKIRNDFVTNSSSSSFIVCFARIADEEKAKKILEQYPSIRQYTAQEVLENIKDTKWSKWLEYDWAGIDATPSKEYIEAHENDRFVVYKDSEELYPDEDGYCDYDVDYSDFDTAPIDAMTEENGFADVECQYGAGRDG